MSLLEIRDLEICYHSEDKGNVRAVNKVSLTLNQGQTLGLVGETGAGKTTMALGIMKLISSPPGEFAGGEIWFDGEDLLQKSDKEMQKIRGNRISMIFQDPMTALNPIMHVEDQVLEVVKNHRKCSTGEAREAAIDILKSVGIPPERGMDYPHQFSGGMKQRVVIAIALACNPTLLIADEPTTALDVTIQAQVLSMMRNLKEELNTSMILITHDMGIVAENCDQVAVMYAGEIVEAGSLQDIFREMAHPYTIGLFHSIPSIDRDVPRLESIDGLMPDPANLPKGCYFQPRCKYATAACAERHPEMHEVTPGHFVRCTMKEKEGATN